MREFSIKDTWANPRETIATRYKDNDFAYMFHAGVLLFEFLKASGFTAQDLKKKKILDYGCGTGRVTRFLALSGGFVAGYDPTPECIEEAITEGDKTESSSSVVPRIFSSELKKIGKNYDVIISINVLEHLTVDEFNEAITHMTDLLKEGGECYLWARRSNPLLTFKDPDLVFQPKGLGIFRGVKVDGKIPYYELML
jgi:2-polyprenyl-3-methyl-5-hydroxy-6-metoxy-1,4-benzoquinol methylase